MTPTRGPAAGDPDEPEPREADAARRTPPWLLLAGPACLALLHVVPLPTLDGVEPSGALRTVLGLTAWMALWWMTEAVPLAVTSLLPLAVLPLGAVTPARAVAPAYFEDTIALFLGGFCLALGLERTGLHRRIAHAVVGRAGTDPRRLVLGFFLAAGLVSMWVSNTASALMLMPVATTVVRATRPTAGGGAGGEGAAHRRFAACLVLAVAYGASLGGVGTLVGTPPNTIFRGFVEERGGPGLPSVTFARWLLLGVPTVLVLLPLAWLLLVRVALPIDRRLSLGTRDDLLGRLAPTSKPTRDEAVVFVTFVLTALAWITREPLDLGGVGLPGWGDLVGRATSGGRTDFFVKDSTVAIVAALALFTWPSRDRPGERLLPWAFAAPRLPWGALLLFGGGFALADAFAPSGLNAYLAAAFRGLEGLPPVVVIVVVAFGLTAISEVASNTAAITMMLPVLLPLSQGIGADPLPVLLAGTLAASCGFALPVATVANAIAYGTGEVSPRQMARAGLVLDVAATLVMIAAVLLLAPLAFPR